MIQNGFQVDIKKTNKIKVNENSHALPPDKGTYPEYKVADYFCPEEWSNDGVFIPVEEGDPMWFDFRCNDECALLLAIQRLNPVTNKPADLESGLTKDPVQNYLRLPEQLWIDGYVNDGIVYQFVVTKSGIGLAVNEYVLPKHMQDSHALGFAFFAPKNPKPKLQPNISFSYLPQTEWHYGPYNKTAKAFNDVKYRSSSMPLTSCDCADINTVCDSITMGSSANVSGSSHNVLRSVNAVFHAETDINADENNVTFLSQSAEVTSHDSASCNLVADVSDTIETVDILEEQAKDLTELDKASMGQGGRITQRIVTDNNTVDYYHKERSALLTIYLALPDMFKAIMDRGKRQSDDARNDPYKKSGMNAGTPVPLID